MFSAQGKLVQAWHILRWLHAAYTIASTRATKTKSAVSTLQTCIEKGWLFATNGECPEAERSPANIVVPSREATPEDFSPSMDLLYNYVDQLEKLNLTKTCWHLFEWLQTAFMQACKRDMNPYSTGPTAVALKNALASCHIVASPRDVPYMQDIKRMRSSVGFSEENVRVTVNDKLWDRLPGSFQLELLELGRKPETARDRYGVRLAEESCTHKHISSPNHLLAAGGCACANREDVEWSELPRVEAALLKGFNKYSQQTAKLVAPSVAHDRTNDTDENFDDNSSDTSDLHHDTDSAYESDDDDDSNSGDGPRSNSPKVKIVQGSPNSSFCSLMNPTHNIIQHVQPKVGLQLPSEMDRVKVMQNWIANVTAATTTTTTSTITTIAVATATIKRTQAEADVQDEEAERCVKRRRN